MSKRFFQSNNRPGYLHPVSSELENSGIRVAVRNCSGGRGGGGGGGGGGHMSKRFFQSNRPGYLHPELENSGIRVAVGNCSVTERRRWLPPYQTGKTVHVHAKHYKHNKDGRTVPGVCGNGSVPLSH